MIARGTPTTRRAAFDLGGPRVTADPEARRLEKAARTRTQPAAKSKSLDKQVLAGLSNAEFIAITSLARLYLEEVINQPEKALAILKDADERFSADQSAVQTIWGPEQNQQELHVEFGYDEDFESHVASGLAGFAAALSRRRERPSLGGWIRRRRRSVTGSVGKRDREPL